MDTLIRCECCQGRKRVLAMGGMEKPCTACKAIGWIESSSVAEIKDNVTNANGMPVILKKKPGRRPKLVNRDILQCIEGA